MAQTIIQFFHWYYAEDASLWRHFASQCDFLASLGIDKVWLPPPTKGASGARSVGYDPYDLYDLGEFEQKGSIATKYGTKLEYKQAIEQAHSFQIQILADVVMNHKAGADFVEVVWAAQVKEENRNSKVGEPRWIKGLTGFSFPVRKATYSNFVWNKSCFKAVDWDIESSKKAIFLFLEQFGTWEEVVGPEKGNYDYLMFADLDFRNTYVRDELIRWAQWLLSEIHVDGFRIDAAKHITPMFLLDWLKHLAIKEGKVPFAVAEFWSGNRKLLHQFLRRTECMFHLFDVPLHYNLYNASREKERYDLRRIFKNTLVDSFPELAVTFVDNHDTQPCQALESWILPWFRPLAYALILLRKQGTPCVFYTDLYGAAYQEMSKQKKTIIVELPKVKEMETLLQCREQYSSIKQMDYFDSPNCIGWIRWGKKGGHSAMVVIMSNHLVSSKSMKVGKAYSGKCFVDILGNRPENVIVDEDGFGMFVCGAGSVSVYVLKQPL